MFGLKFEEMSLPGGSTVSPSVTAANNCTTPEPLSPSTVVMPASKVNAWCSQKPRPAIILTVLSTILLACKAALLTVLIHFVSSLVVVTMAL
jgi:hypothetical protein